MPADSGQPARCWSRGDWAAQTAMRMMLLAQKSSKFAMDPAIGLARVWVAHPPTIAAVSTGAARRTGAPASAAPRLCSRATAPAQHIIEFVPHNPLNYGQSLHAELGSENKPRDGGAVANPARASSGRGGRGGAAQRGRSDSKPSTAARAASRTARLTIAGDRLGVWRGAAGGAGTGRGRCGRGADPVRGRSVAGAQDIAARDHHPSTAEQDRRACVHAPCCPNDVPQCAALCR